jgi:hypothetical protein
MSFKDFFIKNILVTYFLTVACITGAMGIIGSVLAPETSFGYEVFLSPFLFGLVAVIPSLATYSRKELTARQMLFRLVLHFILLELMILLFAYIAGLVTSTSIALSLALAVLIIDVTVLLLQWLNDRRVASELNNALRQLQQNDNTAGLG